MLRPPLDPQVAPMVAGFPPFAPDRLPIMRERSSAIEASELVENGTVTVTEYLVPNGSIKVPLTVYRKAETAGNRPIIFWIHGGGLIVGHRFQEQPTHAKLVADLDLVITSVDYRLAPEYPYPAGFEDCFAALNWVAENGVELGGDPHRILIMGGSAGGNLAAACAIAARDWGKPRLIGQMLFCPMLDDRLDSVSQQQYATNTKAWGGDANKFAWECYLGANQGGDGVPATAAPGRLTDLSNLPPTFLDCGDAELFRDDVVAYASRLWAAGVPTDLHIWAGGCHGFEICAPDAFITTGAKAARMNWLARLLGSN